MNGLNARLISPCALIMRACVDVRGKTSPGCMSSPRRPLAELPPSNSVVEMAEHDCRQGPRPAQAPTQRAVKKYWADRLIGGCILENAATGDARGLHARPIQQLAPTADRFCVGHIDGGRIENQRPCPQPATVGRSGSGVPQKKKAPGRVTGASYAERYVPRQSGARRQDGGTSGGLAEPSAEQT